MSFGTGRRRWQKARKKNKACFHESQLKPPAGRTPRPGWRGGDGRRKDGAFARLWDTVSSGCGKGGEGGSYKRGVDGERRGTQARSKEACWNRDRCQQRNGTHERNGTEAHSLRWQRGDQELWGHVPRPGQAK